ncbi:MAG: amino acid ABC transporter ATP-binding protein [Kiritimatiellia bacterium]|jgi:polar amino acid transport system ATP-binding protein
MHPNPSTSEGRAAALPVLSMRRAAKSFGDVRVLRDISLDVRKGEVVSILGPSGSGKSTLLRCATGLETLDAGDLAYGDLRVVENGLYAPKPVRRAALRRFGLVFQNFNLFPHFSVLRNITAGQTSVLRRTPAEAEARAHDLLKRMGLSDKADAYPYELSGGQQQRVSIARALAMDPEILFFDEPTSALDPELTGEILRVIRDLATQHWTMVIVTHEISFARNVSDRIVFMDGGVIVEEGTPADVIDNPSNERTRAFLSNLAG